MFCDWAKGWRLYNRLDRGCYLQIHDDVSRAIPNARSGWLGQPPAAGCDRLPARGEPCAPSRASGKRLRLSDDDRRRLAVKAQALGREALAPVANTDTKLLIYRRFQKAEFWHRTGCRP